MWATILTSAAVGVLVSGVITLAGQFFERRARQRELLFTKALEMGIRRNELLMKAAGATGYSANLVDDVLNAGAYYDLLESLLRKGKLPDAHQPSLSTPIYKRR